MKITKYRMDQLEEARKIQKDCIKQHLPCPPVAWWRAEILDENGKVEEQIDSKCNSYTRNGLNLIAQHSMYLTSAIASSEYFGDGTLSYKNIEGAFLGTGSGLGYLDGTTIIVGNGLDLEHLNAHRLSNDITSSFSVSNTQTTTTFDNITRTLQTAIQRTLTNNTEQPITLTEAGIQVGLQRFSGSLVANRSVLVVRDLLEVPIEIPAGKSLTFTYNFELLYPE